MSEIRSDLQLYPRIPDKKTIHDPRYNPDTYISIQTRVNNSSQFEDKYINKMIQDGWVSLKNIIDIFLYPKGKQFKYRLNGNSLSNNPEGTFRSGGFFLGKNENESDEKKSIYFLYKGYNGVIFPLQIKDIQEIYIKIPNKDIPTFKKPILITNYIVYLYNKKTKKDEIVYYAKDNTHRNRFMNSMKYKKALATGVWSWSILLFD